ncbi:serine/threonine-protein kinase ATG1a isoform X2 [Magnolia sinica]|uniref:serine/threonine-protein kinase ATG1a isoform X2 n=1 Tax=Magnolia sinica TaxID=86752 RepID=UPI002658115E|nr:serine/threonine-protein kinase ATG1a isoform X2 [Magnolia sinica]
MTADKIYLVLEYCIGGDLAAYIERFGRVSEAIARHFMRQLASGLQVLRETNLIHRDLKPQNLLLSSKDETPILKIGDFGFARYLTPQGLAETLCGSPLYMAPEIIQNQKYDAKADLWSVGAILFQLVTGKPPFEGNCQYQLFHNILASNEPQFPQGVLEELHPDCIDLCRSLLRRNPVERLTFEEFFNHKFMVEPPRPTMGAGDNSPLQERGTLIEQEEELTDDKLSLISEKGPHMHSGSMLYSSVHDESIISQKKQLLRKESSPVATGDAHECSLNATVDSLRKSVDGHLSSSSDQGSMEMGNVDRGLSSISTTKVADSLELIERDYVLVPSNFTSVETLTSSLEASVQETSATRISNCPKKTTVKGIADPVRIGEPAVSSVGGAENLGCHGSAPLAASRASTELVDVQRQSSLHPSTRLRFLHQYVHSLSELAQEKLNAQLHLESFSIELVALAVWKEAYRVCSSWVASSIEGGSLESSSAKECPPDHEGSCSSLNLAEDVDFRSPASICSWVKKGFIDTYNRADKISSFIQNMNGSAEMPDAMDIVYQTALAAGKSGAVDELMENRSSAAASYSKATTLLSFILTEATSLPLNPPFSLSVSDQQRIHGFITRLKAHQSQSEVRPPQSPKQTKGYLSK